MNPLFIILYALLVVGLVVANLIGLRASKKKLEKLGFKFDELGDELPRKAALCVMDPHTCIWCVRLEEDTLRNERVVERAAARSVRLVRCRPADFARLAVSRGWRPVRGMPTTVFVGADGSEAGRKVGYCGASEMCSLLESHFPAADGSEPSAPAQAAPQSALEADGPVKE